MADKNIQITVRNPANTDWDVLYPQTKSANIIDAGSANGVATLDATGKVPLGQLGNVPAAPVQSVNSKTGAVNLTKTDVGLGSVNNYGVATEAEAQAGTSNLKYMTPIRTMDSVKEYSKVLYNGSYYYAKLGVNPDDASEFGVILTPVS